MFILVLSPNFFKNCIRENDVVKHEIKVAAQNSNITFYPIVLEHFKYDNEDLSCFTSEEINRFRYQTPISYNGIYNTLFIDKIKDDILYILNHGLCIEDLKRRNKNRYWGANEEKEKTFLKCQTDMLLKYDKKIGFTVCNKTIDKFTKSKHLICKLFFISHKTELKLLFSISWQ